MTSLLGADLLILTEGGRDRGLGHVMRCSAYAEAWRQAGGQVRWIVDGDEAVRAASPADADVELRDWRTSPDVAGAQAVLVDSYALSPTGRAMIAERAAIPVFLEDAGRDLYPRGLVVDARLSAVPGPRAEWLCGPRWQALRMPFVGAALRPPSGQIRRVLVMMGGTDPRALSARMAMAVRVALPSAVIEVAGQATGLPADVAAHGLLDATALARLMRDSDLAVSAAGQSVSELAAIGVPTVLVQVADNQAPNMVDWPKAAGFIAAGTWDHPGIDQHVTDAVSALASPAIRQAVSQSARGIVDGRGGERLVERIANLLASEA
jgi:UDP-2,4-diacetamido-2,4,6-trideoxy-beta-L-altropyranose hydrolase